MSDWRLEFTTPEEIYAKYQELKNHNAKLESGYRAQLENYNRAMKANRELHRKVKSLPSTNAKTIAALEAEILRLNEESERLTNALDYIYQSGEAMSRDAVQKARWGLGLEVENEAEIAALKPRFSQ